MACGDRSSRQEQGLETIAHVHGLGVNPADGRLYVATHHGLFVLDESGQGTKVGTTSQDTMGFTVVGPDHFLASGHPEFSPRPRPLGERPLLGLIESSDAGRTWRTLSLKGEADFHGLAAAHGRTYGWNTTTSQFMVSVDGKTWETRSQVALASFALDPNNADRIVASGDHGQLTSSDGGRTWQPGPGPRQAFLSWEPEGGLWAADAEGQLAHSADGGATWQQRGQLPAPADALLAHGGRLFLAAEEGIFVSSDEGRTWRPLYRPG